MFSKVRTFLEMIKFEHTVFALPFAYTGMVAAAGGWPGWGTFGWITLAMAAARTAGMSLNRLIDRRIDALNPRTANRPIQSGRISAQAVAVGALLSLGLLAFAAWQLNRVTFYLWPGAVAFLVGYPYAKRFTWLSHFVLGFTDGLAPLGAWIAVTGSFWKPSDVPAWLLLFVVIVWMAGFDIIYACQDVEADRRAGLRSIPAGFGIAAGLTVSRLCHALTVIALIALGRTMGLGLWFWVGTAVIAGLLIYEQSLVSPRDLSKINVAFFNVNGYISMTLFAATLAALLL